MRVVWMNGLAVRWVWLYFDQWILLDCGLHCATSARGGSSPQNWLGFGQPYWAMDNPIQVIDGFKDSCFTFGHHVGHNCQVPCLDFFNGKNLLTFGSLFNLGSKLESLALMARWVSFQAVISQSGCWEWFLQVLARPCVCLAGHLRSAFPLLCQWGI